MTNLRRLAPVIGLAMIVTTMSACATLGGAAVGAGAGAAIGAGTGKGAGKGALVGAGVGAAAGTIYDWVKK
jgi:osmotically inducible lipoprotein OsmB